MGKRFQTWNKDACLRVLREELSPFNLSNLVFLVRPTLLWESIFQTMIIKKSKNSG